MKDEGGIMLMPGDRGGPKLTERPRSRLAIIVASIYALLCVGALLLPMFAKPSENLAAAYAILLAIPWSILFLKFVDALAIESLALNYFILCIGMAINATLLYFGISAISARFS